MYNGLVLFLDFLERGREEVCHVMLFIPFFFFVNLRVKYLLRFLALLLLVSWIIVMPIFLVISVIPVSASPFFFYRRLLLIIRSPIHLPSEDVCCKFFSLLIINLLIFLPFRRRIISECMKSLIKRFLTFCYILLFLMYLYFLQFGEQATIRYFWIDTITF